MTRLLVTGAAGFIGSNFVDLVLAERPDLTSVTGLDKLGYAGDVENLRGAMADPRFRFVEGDVTDADLVGKLVGEADEIAHFAAESMVDRSVLDPAAFIRSNVVGTGEMLQAARHSRVSRFLHISTPEVYGQRVGERAREEDTFAPRNVYAGSKAAGEMLVSAYRHSFGLPIVITRGSTAVGPRQHPEKVTPRMIISAIRGEPLPVYGDGSARRDFVHVSDLNRANELVLRKGEPGTAYNVLTGEEHSIRQLAIAVLDLLGKPHSSIGAIDDRVAHDRHYLMDNRRITELGWYPRYTIEQTLAETVAWYVANRDWWQRKVDSADFQGYLAASRAAREQYAAGAT